MNDEVEEIKRRIDVVDLVSSYLTLKKAGANYRAICPFHQEKTPSLMVSPEKQIWHCFGCSKGGDVFTFVMEMENLEFPEALKMLAERAGVTLKRREFKPEEGKDTKTKLFEINKISAKVFQKILVSHPAGKIALEYLKKRKLTDKTIKEFVLGYAPSKKVLFEYLKKQGFTNQEIIQAGSPDKFFRRIIFPIQDIMGNVLAFTGRVLDPKQEPKYLNTPETAIFHKGRILYNLVNARGEIKTQKATVVVEGQMDVIASFQAGVKNVVATSGTALTDEHLKILYRYTPNIIFAFDSDTAGLLTAKKAYEMAIIEGFNVKMVELGKYKDPGEMIAENPALWQEAVSNALPVIDWYFELAFNRQQTTNLPAGKAGNKQQELTSQEKKEIAKEILPVIKKIPDSIEQAHYVGLLAKRLGISENVIFDALLKVKSSQGKSQNISKINQKYSSSDLLIGILLKMPKKIVDAKGKIKISDISSPDNQAIYKELIKLYNQDEKEILTALKKVIDRQLQLKVDGIILFVDDLNKTSEDLEKDYQEAISIITSHSRENLKDYYAQEIQKAESARDIKKLQQLIKDFQHEISK